MGTGIGALGSLALAVTNASLFVVSRLLAPLFLLGWGASIRGLVGATAGASAGAGDKKGWLSDWIGAAIANGQGVLVVETRTPQETDTARELIQPSVGASKDAKHGVNAIILPTHRFGTSRRKANIPPSCGCPRRPGA